MKPHQQLHFIYLAKIGFTPLPTEFVERKRDWLAVRVVRDSLDNADSVSPNSLLQVAVMNHPAFTYCHLKTWTEAPGMLMIRKM